MCTLGSILSYVYVCVGESGVCVCVCVCVLSAGVMAGDWKTCVPSPVKWISFPPFMVPLSSKEERHRSGKILQHVYTNIPSFSIIHWSIM